MSATMVKAVLASSIEPAGVRLVALVLAWHANDASGHAWPSLNTIANESALSRERVKQCVRALKDADVIELVTKGGGAVSSRYRFSPDWVGKHATRVVGSPGERANREGGSGLPKGGKPATPNKDERKAKPSLSSKSHRASAAGPGRSAAGSSPAAAAKRTFSPDYYATLEQEIQA